MEKVVKRPYSEWDKWDELDRALTKEIEEDEKGPAPAPAPAESGPEPEHALAEAVFTGGGEWKDICGDGSIFKKVTKPGDAASSKPVSGAGVKCHYVGRLLDGTKFDSSRDRSTPFEFKAGSGVIQGWSDGIVTMEVGETAHFAITSEKAYGAQGSPPKIPPHSTLQFEIELLSWSEFEDVVNTNGNVQMKVLAEGTGFKKPEKHAICRVRMELGGGELNADSEPAEHRIGGGTMVRGVEFALLQMKEGAKSELLIEPEWATTAPSEPVPDEKLQVKLELVNWDEVTDVSKDGGVLLRSAPDGSPGAGEGWKKPTMYDICRVKYTMREEGSDDIIAQSDGAEGSEMTLGSGDMCVGLELALMEMKKGATAKLTLHPGYTRYTPVGDEPVFSTDKGKAGTKKTAEAEVELVDWVEVEDLTEDKKGGLLLKILSTGAESDYKMPKDLASVRLHYKVSAAETGAVIADSRALSSGSLEMSAFYAFEESEPSIVSHYSGGGPSAEPREYVVDEDDEICPGLDAALKKMKKGSVAELRVSPSFQPDADWNTAVLPRHRVELLVTLECADFVNLKETWELKGAEKLELCERLKFTGNLVSAATVGLGFDCCRL